MSAGGDAATRAGHLLEALAARALDVLPALGAVAADVRSAWPDAAGREWAEHAERVRRALQVDLDAALAAARVAHALARAAGDPAEDQGVEDRGRGGEGGPASRGSPEGHATQDRPSAPPQATGGPAGGLGDGPSPGARARSTGRERAATDGPRLGGTAADRTDDETGMRIATLDGPG